jgi:hypothetical protein
LRSKKSLLAGHGEIVKTKAGYPRIRAQQNRYSDNLSMHRKQTLPQGSSSVTEKLSVIHLACTLTLSI